MYICIHIYIYTYMYPRMKYIYIYTYTQGLCTAYVRVYIIAPVWVSEMAIDRRGIACRMSMACWEDKVMGRSPTP